MFKKILNNKSKSIAAAAIVLGAASLISRLLGLVRDRILAGTFGASNELDIYYAAFRIPDLVYSLLVLGAISAGFIPVFLNYLQRDKGQAWYLASSVLNLMTLSLIIACSLLIVFAPYLMKLVAPGFSEDKLSMAIKLTRIMFLSPIFLGLSAVLGGILQSFRRFLVYSLGPIMYNLGIIFGALFLVRYFGLLGLAIGVVLGAFLHMAVQIPTAVLCGFRWSPVFNFKFIGVKRIFRLMPPRILSLTLYQVNAWLVTVLASFLAVGSIAVYNLAHNIWSFPLGIFGISFVLASFPKLSQSAQKKDKDGFIKTFSITLRQILFFILPASVLFIALRSQIVEVILGTGRFTQADIILTYQTLAFLSLSLFAEALVLLFLRGFFAYEDAWKPFFLGLVASGIRISLAWYFSKTMGVPGLALGFSLGSIFYLIFLFIALKRKLGGLNGEKIFVPAGKMLFASILAGVITYASLSLTNISALTQGGLAGLIGVLAYFLIAWILRVKELNLFCSSLVSRLPWKKMETTEVGE
ncbi:MAG: murein biosynthesis integral membrane protein MurJ [Candidatus Portnoybacteria bacterium]